MSDLLISVGDYVIVQEGQVDQPKIIVWEDVSVEDVFGEISNDLLINVFDAVVAEDPTVPSLIFNVAIVVFDSVRVQEGQADSDARLINLSEDVTVTESVTATMTLLRISVSDVVTIVDASEIFASGPVGIVTFESVTVQEAIGRYLSLYINAFDTVVVVDGALNMDVSDAVSVTEDLTIKLARLVLDVNETVTVAESIEMFGTAHNLTVFDELVVDESVTVLLTSLRPTVSEDVTVAESVTVSVSSITLLMDIADSVTVADVLEIRTTPIQINEFTQVIVTESATILTGILSINLFEAVTVAESLSIALLPILLDLSDSVTVTERVALRIGKGGRKRHDLTVVGAGE